MYIHLGLDVVVLFSEIIAIFSKDIMNNQDNEVFLLNNSVVDLSQGSYKSVVITKEKVYLSPFSVQSIKKGFVKEKDFSRL